MFRTVFITFILAVILQATSAQSIGLCDRATLGAPRASLIEQFFGPELASGVGTFGGSFAVASACPVQPRGLSIVSDNYYDGTLRIVGEVPFLSTISVEGAVPSVGAGAITYGCGSGNVAILNEDIRVEPRVSPTYGFGPAASSGFNTCPCGRAALF